MSATASICSFSARTASILLGAAILFSVGARPLTAQETRGEILGRVTDSSGAVVPGATVKVVNTATNVESTAVTNPTGDYRAPFLIPGSYKVSAELAGFKTFTQEDIPVRVSDRVTINVTLEVGQTSERVRVTGEAPMVEAASASMGQVVDNRRVVDLPLKDGNPMMLASIAPGVMNFTTASMTVASAVASPAAISVNGVRSTNNEFSMDGAPNTSRSLIAYAPPAEVVQEFKMQTATFDAAQGFTPGATINVSLKSGTNDLHGALLHFVQNPVFNANKFFSNRAALPKAILRMNRYGASGDGPLVIPKLYNGRNRTFWTYGYEGFKLVDPRGTLNTTVPTAAQRGGDFSQLLRLGPQYQIYDPATIAPAAAGRFSREPLPGNIVPASRIHPLSAKLVQLWSTPNLPGTTDGQQNWTTPGQEWMHYYTHVARFDHTISDKNRMFVRVDMNNHDQRYDVRSNGAVGSLFHRRNSGIALDDVHIFSPGFLLNVRYSLTRFVEASNALQNSFDLAALGFSQVFIGQLKSQVDPRGIKLPNIAVSGYDSFSTDNAWVSRGDSIHSLAGNLTRIVRGHTMRFGAEYRIYQENVYNVGQSSGAMSFGVDWTRGPLDTSPAAPIGQGMAAFLFGLPSGGSIVSNDSYAEQSKDLGLYFGDDWKVTSRLTVNIGLRYELETPITERFNRSVGGFDFTTPSPIEAQVRAAYAQRPIPQAPADQFRVLGGLTFAGAGQPRTLWKSDRNNLMPRFGFAYAANPRTVVRGGYGLFYDQLGITRQHVIQTGYSRTTNLVPTLDNGQTFVANIANPFPTGFAVATGSAFGSQTFLGQGVSFYSPAMVAPYMQRWQLGVQRELMRDTVLEIAYVGNRGTAIRVGRQADPVPRQYYSTSPVRDQTTIDFLAAQVSNPFYPLLPGTSLAGQNVSRSQLLRPYPHFTTIGYSDNPGYSWYHAMQTRFEKRFSSGYTFNVAWTWSKFMEATGYLNDTDPMPERVISDQDRTHRVVVTALWELPFGQGRRFGASARGLAGRLIGGWQLQGIYQKQSGPALGFGNSIFNGDLATIPLPKGQRTVDRWFNVDAGFERNSSRQLGSNLRTMPSRYSGIRGDGINNWDLSMIKAFRIGERVRFQFRAEFINAWNHTQFSAPNTTPSASGFGTVTAESQYPRTIQLALKLRF